MTISPDLFLAVLSMDAYNHGFAAGIKDGNNNDPDGLGDSTYTQIGNATIREASNSNDNSPEFAAGFYALAYTLDTDETVIAYRGTDGLTLGASPSTDGSNIFNGLLHGAGTPTNPSRNAADRTT